jgi:hypothetical protein
MQEFLDLTHMLTIARNGFKAIGNSGFRLVSA